VGRRGADSGRCQIFTTSIRGGKLKIWKSEKLTLTELARISEFQDFSFSPVPPDARSRSRGGVNFKSHRHQLISISYYDSAGIARTTCATFLEVAFLVTVGIFIGMNDDTAAVCIKQAETAR